jgi:hypothetical protein
VISEADGLLWSIADMVRLTAGSSGPRTPNSGCRRARAGPLRLQIGDRAWRVLAPQEFFGALDALLGQPSVSSGIDEGPTRTRSQAMAERRLQFEVTGSSRRIDLLRIVGFPFADVRGRIENDPITARELAIGERVGALHSQEPKADLAKW